MKFDALKHTLSKASVFWSIPIWLGVCALPSCPEDPSFAIYAENKLVIRNGTSIKGDVGTTLTAAVQEDVGNGHRVSIIGAKIEGNVYGDSVLLDEGAVVGKVFANTLEANRAEYESVSERSGNLPEFPIAPRVEPGENALIVPRRTSIPLRGKPSRVEVAESATLVLEGGVYEIEQLKMARGSRLEVDGPSRLLISQTLEVGPNSYVGPSDELKVLNLHIIVAGADVNEVPRAILKEDSEVIALLSVPKGTLSIGDRVKAGGAFYGYDVDVAENADIGHYGDLPVQSDQCMIPYCEIYAVDNGTIDWNCYMVPVPAGGECDDGNVCTYNDICDGNGYCLSGTQVADPDPQNDNPCLRDTCHPTFGIYEPEGTPCDTVIYPCADSACNGHGECFPADAFPDETPCDDSIPNNGEDLCYSGKCYGSMGPYDCLANNCSATPGAPPDLDCWLTEHPSIKGALRWNIPVLPNSSTTIIYDNWEPWRKQQLQQAFEDAWTWYDSGMTSFPGTAIPEPPTNHEPLGDGDYPVTVFDDALEAWPLYIAHVAQILMVEIRGLVPWTLCDYEYYWESFTLLSAQAYYWHPHTTTYSGYVVLGSVTPAHPTKTFSFLVQNQLIGTTRLETIANVLNWTRGMSHFIGPFTTKNMEDHWQYRGGPPVSRIIDGTIVNPNAYSGFPDPRHWTRGCWGTSDFLKNVLRVVNIPVWNESVPNNACPHATPHFLSEGMYLSHGDDPYISYWREGNTSVVPPMEDFLIDQATYSLWFEGDPNEACNNIGRQPYELMIDWLPDQLVEMYCDDVANSATHATGSVFQAFQNWYTVQDLEAKTLWQRLSQQATVLGLWCGGM